MTVITLLAAAFSLANAQVAPLAPNGTPPPLKVAGWANAPEGGFKFEQARGKVVLLAFVSGFC